MMKLSAARTLQTSACLITLGVAIWWMGAKVVWLGDDLDYKYMMQGEIWQSWGHINSIKDFFKSQWIHYCHVNGRYVAHAIVQLFNSQLGQQAFAVCNAIAYLLFALTIAKAVKVKPAENPGGMLSAICISVLCFITKMMPTCQIGYIWAMLANVVWLSGFFRNRLTWWSVIALMLAGAAVGNWQESVSIGVCGGLGIWWIIMLTDSIRTSHVRFDWKRSWMLLGYVAGTAGNCFAPSTMGRVAGMTMPISDQLLIAAYSLPAIIMLAVCIPFAGRSHTRKRIWQWAFSFRTERGSIPNGVLTAGMLTLLCFNTAIGIYSNRQLFGANLFAAILLLRLLPRHRFNIGCNALASIAVIAFWAMTASGITEVRRQYAEIERLYDDSKDGNVYYDRTRVMTLGFPVRAKYYEDIVGQFDNDLHHSMMKDFKHTKKGRTLKLKPTVNLEDGQAISYAPGHFTVTLKEPPKGEAPREIIVYGHYPFGIKAGKRQMEVTRYSKRSKTHGMAVIIPEFPFFTADSIAILPER